MNIHFDKVHSHHSQPSVNTAKAQNPTLPSIGVGIEEEECFILRLCGSSTAQHVGLAESINRFSRLSVQALTSLQWYARIYDYIRDTYM